MSVVREDRRLRNAALGCAGAALLLAAAGVHLDLYLTGYRHIPTIGQLFLVQVASAVMLAVAVVASVVGRPRSITAPIAASGAAFALGTIGAYAVSRAGDLFGFHELPTTAGLVSGLLEVGAFGVLGFLACGGAVRQHRPEGSAGSAGRDAGRTGALSAHRRGLLLGVGAVTPVLLALVLVAGVAGSTSPSRSSEAVSRTAARVVHVVVSNYSFHPARIVVRPGAVIEVTDEDSVAHTMTAVPGSVPFGRFDSGAIDPGRTVRFRAPKRAGSYDFYCAYHQFMRGVLVVRGTSRSPSAAGHR